MTVKELIDASPFCDTVEVVIRDNGKWVQGYRIGKNVKIFPAEQSAEYIEKRNLNRFKIKARILDEGEEIDVQKPISLPLKIICKDVKKMPDYVGNLEVDHILPRHIPSYHKEQLTHNDFLYDITAYPPDRIVTEVEEDPKQEKQIEGQMDISEWLGTEG